MTIREVARQLHDLSVGGYFNGIKFTRKELERNLADVFRPGTQLRAGNRYVMEIALPDGRWLFTVNRYGDKSDGFDYTIPATREEEQRIRALLQEYGGI